MTIYFISGLGADQRVFQRLTLPETWTIRHIAWLAPVTGETIVSYSSRISKLIDPNEEFAIIGLSFGGIIATELTKTLKPKLTIILSSVSTHFELPATFRLFRFFNVTRIIPLSLLKSITPLTYWIFGTQKKEEKKLLRQIIHDTSGEFLKWAFQQIPLWKNSIKPGNIFHIHGTKDRIFPCHKTFANVKIIGAGHFMVYNRAEEISGILTDKLE